MVIFNLCLMILGNCCLQSHLAEKQVTESVIQFWQGWCLHRGSGHYKSLLWNICVENTTAVGSNWECRRLRDFVGIFRKKMTPGVKCGTLKGDGCLGELKFLFTCENELTLCLTANFPCVHGFSHSQPGPAQCQWGLVHNWVLGIVHLSWTLP